MKLRQVDLLAVKGEELLLQSPTGETWAVQILLVDRRKCGKGYSD